MKINVAAGKQTWEGFFCIDAVQHPKASRALDLLFAFEFEADGALTAQIDLQDGCADEVHCYHFIEHVTQWQAGAVVRELGRLLKPGGLLVMECPDIEKAARNLLAGMNDQMVMWPLYGDPGHKDHFMTHRWGYTPATLGALLAGCGFERIVHGQPVTHGARANRDMRVEARKP